VSKYGNLIWAMAWRCAADVDEAEVLTMGVFRAVGQRVAEFRGEDPREELLLRKIAARYLVNECYKKPRITPAEQSRKLL
jgi:hypothetical protein